MEEIGSKWFRVEPWKRWCARMLAKITEGGLMPDTAAASGGAGGAEEGESPAIEVRNPMIHTRASTIHDSASKYVIFI